MRLVIVCILIATACTENPDARAVVAWQFNEYPEWEHSGDSCGDMHVRSLRVNLYAGDDYFTNMPQRSVIADCTPGMVELDDLPEGRYGVFVTPLDANGDAMLTVDVVSDLSQSVLATTLDEPDYARVDFPWHGWWQGATGTVELSLTWNGGSCSTASPPVTSQLITLRRPDNLLRSEAVTVDGQPLDGSAPAPCHDIRTAVLPVGPWLVEIEGRDANGAVAYRSPFAIFAGAGNNPAIALDVFR